MSFSDVFRNKNVVITGHTGFKGGWLARWLKLLGANVYGYSLPPTNKGYLCNLLPRDTFKKNILDDICNYKSIFNFINEIRPEFIFHLAAQPLVFESYSDPFQTFKSNSFGVLNILECIRKIDFKTTSVIITSDKCYRNVEWVYGYRENDLLGGEDPYSSSKAVAEQIFSSYQSSFFCKDPCKKVSTARAGNVIGGGDWAPNRIVPDCIRAWNKSSKVLIRSASSTRPWQHVLEPLGGYLLLAMKMSKSNAGIGESFNFGPSSDTNLTVIDVVKKLSNSWDDTSSYEIINDNSNKKESKLLKLSCDKANIYLGWKPRISVEEAIEMTASWYWSYYNDPSMIINLTDKQIKNISSTY
tara:strand:+ start:74137 stop:75204 length:1068 start_codon:yes stop_codon:yes gene_type:complete